MGGNRIFQRQRMQPELIAQAGDGLAVGRFQFDPDEAIRLADVIADVVKWDGLDFGIVEEQAVDDVLQLERGCVAILVQAPDAHSILARFVRHCEMADKLILFIEKPPGCAVHSHPNKNERPITSYAETP